MGTDKNIKLHIVTDIKAVLNHTGDPYHTIKMVREDRTAWKANYFLRMENLIEKFPTCFLVSADNVGSKQMQQIRIALRGKGEVLMGKNTMMRKAIRGQLSKYPQLERILPYIAGNVGFVFTSEDLCEIRDILLSNKKEAPAKAGAIAPLDVFVPAGNTGQGPEKTSFFQALAIPTKITKGTIEILSDIHLIKKDEKVGASEAALLQMLNIRPFHYGLVCNTVYDNGAVFSPDILDITDDGILKKFCSGISNIAAASLAIGYLLLHLYLILLSMVSGILQLFVWKQISIYRKCKESETSWLTQASLLLLLKLHLLKLKKPKKRQRKRTQVQTLDLVLMMTWVSDYLIRLLTRKEMDIPKNKCWVVILCNKFLIFIENI